MKRSLFLAVSLTATILSFARSPRENIVIGDQKTIFKDSLFVQIPSMDMMLENIRQVMCLREKFELKQADVLNIEATIRHKKMLILYNPVFMDWITKATRNKWGAMALIAHEMGHHVYGHTQHRTGSEPALELEADEYAGYVLHKLGASLQEAQEVMYFIATDITTRTHPARIARMMAIQNGWSKAAETNLVKVSNKDVVILP